MHVPNDVAFTAGFFISALYGIVFHSSRIGVLLALIIAIAKEINDQNQYDQYDWVDTVAMMCGAAMAYMLINIIFIL